MTSYRKKPVVIEAMQWDSTEAGAHVVVEWIKAGGSDASFERIAVSASRYNHEYDYKILIRTLEGWISASPDDWIIRGVQGEFYPCKPDIFDATYEAV